MTRCAQQAYEERFGMPIYDLLYSLYYQEGMGIKAIARHIGTSDRTVWNWFDELSIPRRNRSDAVRLQWVDNDERRVAMSEQAKTQAAQSSKDERRAFSLLGNTTLQNLRGPTSIERRLMQALDCASIAYQFQYAVGGKFLCDFAFIDAMLIVECDGTYWHNKPRQQKQDASKDAYLRACGYTVLRLSDKRINENIEECVQAIKLLLH